MKSLLNSFAFRMWCLFSVLGFCLSMPFSYYYSNINYNLLQEHAQTELEAMSKAYALSIELAVQSSDFNVIQETILHVAKSNKYSFVALLEQTNDADKYKLFTCFPDSLSEEKPYYDTTNYYLISSAVSTEIIEGKIVLGISKEKDLAKLKLLNKPIWELTILANIILLLLSSLFFVYITNPIRAASRFAAELSNSDFTSELKTSKGKNEISILHSSLNTLKQNLIKHRETNDNLVNNLTSEIEKQTEEITFKSQLQQLLIKISNDFSAASTRRTSITPKVQESLGVINDFIGSNYAIVIKFDKDKGIYRYANASNNPDYFLKKTEFRLEDSECNELKTLFSDRNYLELNNRDNPAVCKVIETFIANPNKPMLFKIVNPDLSLGGFIVFEETNKELKRLHIKEIQKLIKVFIEMIVNVDMRYLQDESLNNLKDSLEVKVLERTEQLRKNELKLEKSLEKEKELNELKSSFVSTASHQFRTPLAAIQANSDLLGMLGESLDDSLNKRYKKVTSRIKSEVRKMTDLMNDLLVLGKSTSEIMPFRPVTIDIVDFCKKIVFSYSENKTYTGILEFEVKGDPYDFKLDPQLLSHALTNLVDNAFKYSKGKKNPELTLSFNAAEISFRVKDYGIGIPEDELSKMFQPFFRAENVSGIEGTGLGLSIAKEFINKNNGEITISSIEGEGCDIEMIYKQV
jgi:signal transduction histidine kinase